MSWYEYDISRCRCCREKKHALRNTAIIYKKKRATTIAAHTQNQICKEAHTYKRTQSTEMGKKPTTRKKHWCKPTLDCLKTLYDDDYFVMFFFIRSLQMDNRRHLNIQNGHLALLCREQFIFVCLFVCWHCYYNCCCRTFHSGTGYAVF